MPNNKTQITENMNCTFCNSRSHITSNCNSNMKGRRRILTYIGWNFILDDNLPDFKSFPINELRFIASRYENFQKTVTKHNMNILMSRYFDRDCHVNNLYNPIPVTLTKSRLIKELTRRWTLYIQVRTIYNHQKPEDGDCPICMEYMYTHIWNPVKLNWDMAATKPYQPGALFASNIRTPCGHLFCGDCWDMHMTANSKNEYKENTWNDEPTGRMILACPMCRHKMYYIK
jgi:hypothetical protein